MTVCPANSPYSPGGVTLRPWGVRRSGGNVERYRGMSAPTPVTLLNGYPETHPDRVPGQIGMEFDDHGEVILDD